MASGVSGWVRLLGFFRRPSCSHCGCVAWIGGFIFARRPLSFDLAWSRPRPQPASSSASGRSDLRPRIHWWAREGLLVTNGRAHGRSLCGCGGSCAGHLCRRRRVCEADVSCCKRTRRRLRSLDARRDHVDNQIGRCRRRERCDPISLLRLLLPFQFPSRVGVVSCLLLLLLRPRPFPLWQRGRGLGSVRGRGRQCHGERICSRLSEGSGGRDEGCRGGFASFLASRKSSVTLRIATRGRDGKGLCH